MNFVRNAVNKLADSSNAEMKELYDGLFNSKKKTTVEDDLNQKISNLSAQFSTLFTGKREASEAPTSPTTYSLRGKNLSHAKESISPSPKSSKEAESKVRDSQTEKTKGWNPSEARVRPPVPRLSVKDVKEHPLTKRLRKFDNTDITSTNSTFQVFINTNEININAVRKSLVQAPNVLESCHIGFAAWHNFDIMAVRKSNYALLCDLNPETALFLNRSLEILKKSKDRKDFVKQMAEYASKTELGHCLLHELDLTYSINFACNVSDDPIYEEVVYIGQEIEVELKREGGWLHTDENYECIKKLATADKIAVITEDIRATKKFQSIKQLLGENGIQIDTLYISNISEYMYKENQGMFASTVSSLACDDTLIIDAKFTSGINLKQDIVKGKTLREKGIESWFWSPRA